MVVVSALATGCSATVGDAGTVDDVCADSACLGLTLSCDDSNPCTDDSCAMAAGCTPTAIPSCGADVTLPYSNPFDCESVLNGFVAIDAPSSASWTIDASPAEPGALSADCSLNFNNGTNFGCANGVNGVSGTAEMPWIAGSLLGSLDLLLAAAGNMESSATYDRVHVEISFDGSQWTELTLVPSVDADFEPKDATLPPQAAASFYKLRLRFQSQDCIANGGAGFFVDTFSVGVPVAPPVLP